MKKLVMPTAAFLLIVLVLVAASCKPAAGRELQYTQEHEPLLQGVWGSSASDIWAVGGSAVRVHGRCAGSYYRVDGREGWVQPYQELIWEIPGRGLN